MITITPTDYAEFHFQERHHQLRQQLTSNEQVMHIVARLLEQHSAFCKERSIHILASALSAAAYQLRVTASATRATLDEDK